MKKLCGFLILTLGFSFCAIAQVAIQLSPEAPGGQYHMGREYITLNNANIQVELGFDGTYKENLVFDVVVINNTGEPLSFNPSDFYYVLLDSVNSDSSRLPPRMAIHPERILRHYDQTLEARATDQGINTFLGIVETGIGIIASASAFRATENPGFIIDAVFHTIGAADHYMSLDKEISNDLDQLAREKEVVQEEILKLGQIPPGKVVSGFVYFPCQNEKGYLMFCFPLEDQLFQFVYNQQPVY